MSNDKLQTIIGISVITVGIGTFIWEFYKEQKKSKEYERIRLELERIKERIHNIEYCQRMMQD
jgi:hypothetical protein